MAKKAQRLSRFKRKIIRPLSLFDVYYYAYKKRIIALAIIIPAVFIIILYLIFQSGIFRSCGDGICEPSECISGCTLDCLIADCSGNGFCDVDIGESCGNSADCACGNFMTCQPGNPSADARGCMEVLCGDGRCDSEWENNTNCCVDCGCQANSYCNSTIMECVENIICGDGICVEGAETSSNCCVDCGCPLGYKCAEGICTPACGDGYCIGEELSTCCEDCGPCPEDSYCDTLTHSCTLISCGDGVCGPGEGCGSEFECIKDCNCDVLPNCGDGECNPPENITNCCRDCGCNSGYICVDGSCIDELLFKWCKAINPDSMEVINAVNSLGIASARNNSQKIFMIFDYVKNNINSENGTLFDTLKTPDQTLIQGSGDVDDIAVLTASMLEAAGVGGRIVYLHDCNGGYVVPEGIVLANYSQPEQLEIINYIEEYYSPSGTITVFLDVDYTLINEARIYSKSWLITDPYSMDYAGSIKPECTIMGADNTSKFSDPLPARTRACPDSQITGNNTV